MAYVIPLFIVLTNLKKQAMEHIDSLKMPIGYYNGVIVTMDNQDLIYANREPGTTPLNPVERDNLLQNVVELYNAAPNGIQSFSETFYFLSNKVVSFLDSQRAVSCLTQEEHLIWNNVCELVADHGERELIETIQHWTSLYENQHVGVEHTQADKFGLLEAFYQEKLKETFYK